MIPTFNQTELAFSLTIFVRFYEFGIPTLKSNWPKSRPWAFPSFEGASRLRPHNFTSFNKKWRPNLIWMFYYRLTLLKLRLMNIKPTFGMGIVLEVGIYVYDMELLVPRC